jgi:hypothetical protein
MSTTTIQIIAGIVAVIVGGIIWQLIYRRRHKLTK